MAISRWTWRPLFPDTREVIASMEDLPDYVDILAASRMEWEILQRLL
jgi:hypothetical protein